jgi:hypothetical protein
MGVCWVVMWVGCLVSVICGCDYWVDEVGVCWVGGCVGLVCRVCVMDVWVDWVDGWVY